MHEDGSKTVRTVLHVYFRFSTVACCNMPRMFWRDPEVLSCARASGCLPAGLAHGFPFLPLHLAFMLFAKSELFSLPYTPLAPFYPSVTLHCKYEGRKFVQGEEAGGEMEGGGSEGWMNTWQSAPALLNSG